MNHDPIEKFNNISVCQSLIVACSMAQWRAQFAGQPICIPYQVCCVCAWQFHRHGDWEHCIPCWCGCRCWEQDRRW